MFNSLKNKIIPIVSSIACFFIELTTMNTNNQLTSLIIAFVLASSISFLLLIIFKNYSACLWFLLGYNFLCILFMSIPLLLFAGSMIDFLLVYLIIVTIATIFCNCIIFRLFTKNRYQDDFYKFFKVASIIFLVMYTTIFVYSLFSNNVIDRKYITQTNFIPFSTITFYLSTSDVNLITILINLISNVLLFVPIGFYLNIYFEKWSIFLKLSIILFITILVELTQLILSVGIMDIDDILLNFTGGIVGIIIHTFMEKFYSKIDKNNKLFSSN